MLEALAEGSGQLLEEENQGDFPTRFLETAAQYMRPYRKRVPYFLRSNVNLRVSYIQS